MARALRERRERARQGAPRPCTSAGDDGAERRQRRRGSRCAARAGGCSSGPAAERRPGRAPARRRRRGDGARQGAPHARPPRRAPRPARLRAGRRPRARARAADPEADARAPGSHPGLAPSPLRPRADARRCAPAPARDLLRHALLRDRAPLRPRAPRLAAQGDRVGEVPPAAFRRRAEAPARVPDRGRGNGALPPPRLPRPEVVLDRGSRCDGADARRGDRDLRRGRGARGRDRHGPPRPPFRPRAHARAAV